MDCLLPEIMLYVLEFCGPYNFVNRKICSKFRLLVKEVDVVDYLNQLLIDERWVEKFTPSLEIIDRTIDKQLLYLLSFLKEHLPQDLCCISAKRGKLQTLQWAVANGFVWSDETLLHAAWNGHLEVVKYLRQKGWFCHKATKFYIRRSLI